MAIKKQPDSQGDLSEAANDWFRQFLKILELTFVETGQTLPPAATSADYRLAAMRAVKLTLLDSGIDQDALLQLFGRVALEETNASTQLTWNAELNRRRFELVDKDIQGDLSPAEQLELAGLTQLMREQVDTELAFPLEGARKLHRRLAGIDIESTEPEQ